MTDTGGVRGEGVRHTQLGLQLDRGELLVGLLVELQMLAVRLEAAEQLLGDTRVKQSGV